MLKDSRKMSPTCVHVTLKSGNQFECCIGYVNSALWLAPWETVSFVSPCLNRAPLWLGKHWGCSVYQEIIIVVWYLNKGWKKFKQLPQQKKMLVPSPVSLGGTVKTHWFLTLAPSRITTSLWSGAWMCLNDTESYAGQQEICFQVGPPKPDRSKCRGLTKGDPLLLPGLEIENRVNNPVP